LHLRPLPVAAPPVDVVAHRILLGDVGLAPQIGAPVPRQRRAGTLCGRGRPDTSAGVPATTAAPAIVSLMNRRLVTSRRRVFTGSSFRRVFSAADFNADVAALSR
jgi:hypothetical protein